MTARSANRSIVYNKPGPAEQRMIRSPPSPGKSSFESFKRLGATLEAKSHVPLIGGNLQMKDIHLFLRVFGALIGSRWAQISHPGLPSGLDIG